MALVLLLLSWPSPPVLSVRECVLVRVRVAAVVPGVKQCQAVVPAAVQLFVVIRADQHSNVLRDLNHQPKRPNGKAKCTPNALTHIERKAVCRPAVPAPTSARIKTAK